MFLLVIAASPLSPFDFFERITAQEAAKRASQCGLGRVTIRYEADLQEDVLIASLAGTPTDKQLACADKAVSFYTLELPPSVQPRYDAMRDARLSGLFQAQARAWLSARGLLNQVPKYQEGVTDDAVFTRKLESLCGPRAKGAFQSKFGFHALSPEWVTRELNPPDRGEEVFSCLMNATTAVGYKVGFIGNEYYQR
jgi:hypothetical protein